MKPVERRRKEMLGRLWICFSTFLLLASGFHLERRGYRDLVVKVVKMMTVMMLTMVMPCMELILIFKGG